MKRPAFDFGPSPILVELKNERRMLIARSLATDQEWSTQSIRINKVLWHTRVGRGGYWSEWLLRYGATRVPGQSSRIRTAFWRGAVSVYRLRAKLERSSEHWLGAVL
jgi:hypothetical protein